jgi:ribosomal protein S18 acetylase RimI-like enzyme
MVEAIEYNRFEAFGSFGRSPQAETHSDPDIVYVVTNIPVLSPVSSCILHAKFVHDDLDGRIDRALRAFAERRLPLIWNTGPATTPRELPAYLLAHGLTLLLEPAGMAANLDAIATSLNAPAELEIRPVTDAESLRQWAEAFAAGFGVAETIQEPLCLLFAGMVVGPGAPWHLFLGALNGRPVATSALYLGAGVAGIYFVTTLPHTRHHGHGSALTQVCLLKARELGYQTAVLHASPMGRHVYAQLGFQTYCSMGLFVWTPDGQHRAP